MTRYAHVDNDTITTVTGRLPSAARDTETGEWVAPHRGEWSPAQLARCSWHEITEPAQPVFDPDTQKVRRGPVALVDGSPSGTWIVEDLTQDELDARAAADAKEAERVDKLVTQYQLASTRLDEIIDDPLTNTLALDAIRDLARIAKVMIAGDTLIARDAGIIGDPDNETARTAARQARR